MLTSKILQPVYMKNKYNQKPCKTSLRGRSVVGELRSLDLLLEQIVGLSAEIEKLRAGQSFMPAKKDKSSSPAKIIYPIYVTPAHSVDLVKVKVYQTLPCRKTKGPLKHPQAKTPLERDTKKRYLSCTYCNKQILYTQLYEHSYACEKCFLEHIVPLM